MNMHAAVAHAAYQLPGVPGGISNPDPMQHFLPGLTDIVVVPGRRKVPVGRAPRITGWHPIRRGHGLVPFESALERRFLDRIAPLPCLERVRAQPATAYFSVWGERRTYTTDFELWMSHVPEGFRVFGLKQNHFYVEVKHTELLNQTSDRVEYALSAMRIGSGLPVLLFTEQEIHVRWEEYFHV